MTSFAAEGHGTHFHSAGLEYFVHFCFYGQEIRNKFIGHMKLAFCLKGIKTTMDDHENTIGEEISQTTHKAIEKSRCCIIVFCHKFASSTRCLDELVKILECKDRNQQIVAPLFYLIDPSVVRGQKESYGEAMTEHQENFKNEMEKVMRWQLSLHNAANLSGWTYDKSGCESEFIQGIVEDICKRLDSTPSCNADCLAGLKSLLANPQSLPGPGSYDDVDTIGKNGIEGTGSICNNFRSVAQLPRLFTSSGLKKSEIGERILLAQLPTSAASASKEIGEIVVPQVSGTMRNDVLVSPPFEEIGMKRKRLILNVDGYAHQKHTLAESAYFQLLRSKASPELMPSGIQDGFYRELNRTKILSQNDIRVEAFSALGAANTSLPTVQDTGSVVTWASEEMKSALLTLRPLVFKKFSDLILEGPKLEEYIHNNVLSLVANEELSGVTAILEEMLSKFPKWSQYYKDAETTLKTTNADLSKAAEVQSNFEAVVCKSYKVVGDEKKMCSKLDRMLRLAGELEEQLNGVKAEITRLSSSIEEVRETKRLLYDEGTKLKNEKDILTVHSPRIKGDQEAARITQENIEAEWRKLGIVFNELVTDWF